MTFSPILILGCGFTGIRVAERMLARSFQVTAVSRDPEKLSHLKEFGADILPWNLSEPEKFPDLKENSIVLHSIPDTSEQECRAFRAYLVRLNPQRVIYISTTGVYGSHATVDGSTQVAPGDDKNSRRVEEENFVLSGAWTGAVLRAAAIYGPNRGVHTQLRVGKEPRARSGIVSRIHVDDLAAHVEAAMLSDWTGALPVADEHPCSSDEISRYCRQILGLAETDKQEIPIEIPGRRVDGSEVRRALHLKLRYPSYHSGVVASIAEES